MTTKDRHAAEQKKLSRRHAVALLGGVGIAALAPCPAFAVSLDFAAFNRRYITDIIVPRFAKLEAACASWSEKIAPMVRQPSAGKVDLMGRGDDSIWEEWMAVEPFMYLPGPSQKREMELAGWARRPAGLRRDVDVLLTRSAPEDLSPQRIADSRIGPHSLEVMNYLLKPDGKDVNMTRDFYLAENGPRRTSVLQAVVNHMRAEAGAAGRAWAKIAKTGNQQEVTARRMTTQFLADQIDLLGRMLRRELAFGPYAIGDGGLTGLEARRDVSLLCGLEVASAAIQSPAGFGALLADDRKTLGVSLNNACATALDLGYKTGRYPLLAYKAGFPISMCCFCTVDMIEDERKRAEVRSEEARQQFEELCSTVTALRNLLATDLAEAVGLTADLKKI